jgi:hypothetical protein
MSAFTVDRSQYVCNSAVLSARANGPFSINISEALSVPRRKADQTSSLMIAGILTRVKSKIK